VRREKNKSENRSKQITRPARNSRPKDTRINRKSENRSRSSRQESPQQKESKSQNRSSKRRGR
jgi:hypothetical protein